MRHFNRIVFFALVMLISGACGTNRWLEAHNKYRCMHGVPLLNWDAQLEEVATWRANNCTTCQHCTCQGSSCKPIYSQQYAENATCWSASPTEAVDAWYGEVKNYDYNNPQWSSSTGHFINVVVSTATKVGCQCNDTHCYCDYDSQYGTTPESLKQLVPKQVKTEAQCVQPAP